MSYGLKYFAEAADYFGDLYRVEIHERDYSGADSEMSLSGDMPLILDYPGDEFDIFRPIYGSQLSINIISETDFQYVDLHTADSRKYKVLLFKDAALFWAGWIIPDLFAEPYISPPYPVKITARCGLGELDTIPMPQAVVSYGDGQPPAIKSYVNLYSILRYALNLLNLGLSLREAINIYNAERTTPPTDTDTTLTDTYVDITLYSELSVYQFLSDTFRVFGARLYQQDGYWNAIRVKEYTPQMRIRTISLGGSIDISFDEVTTNTFLISKPQQNFILNTGPEMRINPAWKQFDVVKKFEKLEGGMLLNSDFSEKIILTRTEILQPLNIQIQYPYFAPAIWGKSGIVSSIQSQTTGCRLNPNPVGQWAVRIFQSVSLDAAPMQGIRFSFECFLGRVTSQSPATAPFAIQIKCSDSSQTKYASLAVSPVPEPSEPLVWTNTPTVIVIPDVPVSANYESAGHKYEFPVIELPLTGEYEFSIYSARGVYLNVMWVKAELTNLLFQILDPENLVIGNPFLIDYEDEIKDTIVVNALNRYIPEPIELYGGDLPAFPNVDKIYKYGYRDVLGNMTRIWHDYGDTLEKAIVRHMTDSYREMYQLPQWVLQVPIFSRSIKFDSAIVDYQVINKKYLCVSTSWDLVNNTFNGIFAEIGLWEGAEWILETGYWDDSGIWIDDKQWNDGE